MYWIYWVCTLCSYPAVCIHLFDFPIDFCSHLYPPAANGYTSARASPGLLTVSNGNSLGKVVPAKSPPPPPSPQMVNSRKPDLRVITSQGGKSLMQMVSLTKPTLCCLGPCSFKPWKNLTSGYTILTTIRRFTYVRLLKPKKTKANT